MGCFKLAFLFGGFSCLPALLPPPASSLISLDFFWPFLLSLPGESETLLTLKEAITTHRQGFPNIQHPLRQASGRIPEGGDLVWSVCPLGCFVSFPFLIIFLQLHGTPPCSSIEPGLMAKRGRTGEGNLPAGAGEDRTDWPWVPLPSSPPGPQDPARCPPEQAPRLLYVS